MRHAAAQCRLLILPDTDSEDPFVIRKPRIGYITDFMRINRRMHNKSFTPDNERDNHWRTECRRRLLWRDRGLLLVDLDVIAVGPVVTEVSKDFDRYWASQSAYPAARIIPTAGADAVAAFAAAIVRITGEPPRSHT